MAANVAIRPSYLNLRAANVTCFNCVVFCFPCLSAREFKAGEQLFENYGQPNHIYFTYHGFLLQV